MKIKYFLLPFVEHLNNRKDEFSALCMVYFFFCKFKLPSLFIYEYI